MDEFKRDSKNIEVRMKTLQDRMKRCCFKTLIHQLKNQCKQTKLDSHHYPPLYWSRGQLFPFLSQPLPAASLLDRTYAYIRRLFGVVEQLFLNNKLQHSSTESWRADSRLTLRFTNSRMRANI